ncbi:putative cleavage and polyadenylation specific factor 1, partial [Operophtera brumata]
MLAIKNLICVCDVYKFVSLLRCQVSQLADNDLVGIAFIDTGIYVHRMLAIKNLICVCDVYKFVSLLRCQVSQLADNDLVGIAFIDTGIYVHRMCHQEPHLCVSQLKDNNLVRIAFIDTGIYVHRMLAIKNLICVCDVYKFVSLLRCQTRVSTCTACAIKNLICVCDVYKSVSLLRYQVSQLKDNNLVRIAFIDTGIYVHRMLAIKNLICVCDVYKFVSLLRCQVSQLADNDLVGIAFIDTGIYVHRMCHQEPHLCVSQLKDNNLVRIAFIDTGIYVHRMLAIKNLICVCDVYKSVSLLRYQVNLETTLDGGLGYILPLSEKMYRRLLMLQNVMNNYCCHIAGLNPRAHRTYKSPKKQVGGAARGMLDGDLVAQFTSMPDVEKQDVSNT